MDVRILRSLEMVMGSLTPLAFAAGVFMALGRQSVPGVQVSTSVAPGGATSGSAPIVTTGRSTSLLEMGLPPTAAAALAAGVAASVGVAAGAFLHARRSSAAGLALIAAGGALIRSVNVLFGFSIGAALSVGWLMAVLTLISGVAAQVLRRRAAPPTRPAALALGAAFGALFGLAADQLALAVLALVGMSPHRGESALVVYAFFGAALASPVCTAVGAAIGGVWPVRSAWPAGP